MDRKEILNNLYSIIREVHPYLEDVIIVEESDLVVDLQLDSFDQVELIMTIEDNFDIELDDADYIECSTVGDIVNLIDKEIN